MNTLIIFSISAFLITAVVMFWIDERRPAFIALGVAALLATIGGDAGVHGLIGMFFASPVLLILIPLAKLLKRKHLTKLKNNAVKATLAALLEIKRQDSAEKESLRREDLQREVEMRELAMSARIKADPVSAVLRRQVPVRFDEPARSWLGGLPQMPDDIAWPRGGPNNWPMHFAAQINCGDLPESLWRGQGPREGWLLLFIDGFRIGGGGDESDDETSAVIFIDRLGSERPPPEDLHPVHNLIMSGPSYPQHDVPCVWRRWPLDIVAQRQEIETGNVISFTERQFSPKPTTVQEIYGVAPPSSRPKLDPDTNAPLTWRGVLHCVMALTVRQRKAAKQPPRDLTIKLREGSGWLTRLVTETQTALTDLITRRDGFAVELADLIHEGVQTEDDDKRRIFLENKGPIFSKLIKLEQDTLDGLRAYECKGGEAALEAEIEASVNGVAQWWESQTEVLNVLRAEIETNNLDAPLPAHVWAELNKKLGSISYSVFLTRYRAQAAEGLTWREITLADNIWGGDLLQEHYLDLYVQNPDTRNLIPERSQETIGDIARAIGWDRPHRMGGFADPLQADIGLEDGPLLFQLASDDGMNWMWGDAGAIYLYASDTELSSRKFNGFAFMECH